MTPYAQQCNFNKKMSTDFEALLSELFQLLTGSQTQTTCV